jgi:hypothetical protein
MSIENTWYGPAWYQIKVKGRLGSQWSDWFDGMTITSEGGVTTLTGEVTDQAALHGLFIRIRDTGLQLISVNRIESNLNEEK